MKKKNSKQTVLTRINLGTVFTTVAYFLFAVHMKMLGKKAQEKSEFLFTS